MSKAAQLIEGSLDAPVGLGHVVLGGRIGVAEGKPEMYRGADQALLGAVMQVSLDPLALEIGYQEDPQPRCVNLGKPRPSEGGQAGIAEDQSGGGVEFGEC